MKRHILLMVFGLLLMNFQSPKANLQESASAPTITGFHWKLIEMNGKPVKTDDPKGYYVKLNPEYNFDAYAGCNTMKGHFDYRENRIKFMRIVGTMKGCPNMDAENQLKTVLESVDNFVANGKSLQFRKGEAVLAKFTADK